MRLWKEPQEAQFRESQTSGRSRLAALHLPRQTATTGKRSGSIGKGLMMVIYGRMHIAGLLVQAIENAMKICTLKYIK